MAIIAKSKYLDFKTAQSPQGSDWYYVKRTNDTNKHDSAVVLTVLVKKENKYQFLLLKTKRPPIYAENKAQYSIESPAGLIGDIDSNESLLECAKKELREETGLVKGEFFVELNNCSTSNGLSSETLSFVTVISNYTDFGQSPVSDGGVIVDRFYVDLDKIDEFFFNLDKKIYSIATATLCGIYLAKLRLKKSQV